MDASFTRLLNEGLCEDNEGASQAMNDFQKKGRSKNFSIQEDMVLISAWENVSLDPIKGNNQTQGNYWSRITSFFDEHKSFVSERTPAALKNRWCTIQKSVSKFQGFYNQIEGRNQSGIGETDKVRQAMEMYQSIQGCAFPFSHCWTELRNSPKFSSSTSKKRVRTSPNDIAHTMRSSQNSMNVDCEQDGEERLERPIGRKAAKRLKRMASEPPNETSIAFFKDMREHMSISANKRREEYENMVKIEEEHLELKRKEVQLSETREKREQQMHEISIMTINVTGMEPQLASYYNSLKAEILEKRRVTWKLRS